MHTRETGTIWQIGVPTAEWSVFLRDVGPFHVTFSVEKSGPFLFKKWSIGTFGSVGMFCVQGFGHENSIYQIHLKTRKCAKFPGQSANLPVSAENVVRNGRPPALLG